MSGDASADGPAKIRIDDLTLGQIRAIEKRTGVGASHWSDPTSMGDLAIAVLVIAGGMSEAEAEALPMREVNARVDMSGDDDPDPMTPPKRSRSRGSPG